MNKFFYCQPKVHLLAVAVCCAAMSIVPAPGAHAQPAAAVKPAAAVNQADSPAQVLDLMQRVADWQLAHPSTHPEDDWTQAVGDAGMMALVGISGERRYRDAMVAIGERNEWQLGPRIYHADDHIVGQTYAELYLQMREPKMIAAMRARFDEVLANPHDGELRWDAPEVMDRWAWCDALFMAPPAYARLTAATGDERYLEFAIRQWWKTSDFLYDKNEHLYFRDSRFLKSREANGRKVFWGRGNGWVMGGLVRMLQYIPTHHKERARFVQQFTEMANKLLELQQSDGMWRASLLDPGSYPLQETSGTALYAYALTYGVNQGLLDPVRFGPAVRKAWKSLVANVDAGGKLTHVQPIGEDPKAFNANATEVYGVGAFLLAGSEYYRMLALNGTQPVVVKVQNDSALHRADESVEAPVHGDVVVMDAASSRILPSQGLEGKVLFQATAAPRETRTYLLLPRRALPAVPPVDTKVHARFVSERLDDFAWESDRIAHRVYGPAIMREPKEMLVSSGIDVWSKRTRGLVIDKWYAGGDYHADHGEGLDFYKVGKARGCGGLGIYDGRQLHTSANFSKWKVLANGPLRAVFELSYDSWDAGGRQVAELRRVSIDAGSNFSRVESQFAAQGRPLDIGIGIAQRGAGGDYREAVNWMSYWEPAHGNDGSIGCAIVRPGARYTEHGGNYLALGKAQPGRSFVYHLGAGWSKSGDFPDAAAWEKYVKEYAARIVNPLRVEGAAGRPVASATKPAK
ncbi:glycoside hydrolase family 88 protein [Massilia cavernae]|nr:glycoside hydrolase family 88 protein [Massilia cavernae]